MRQTYERKNSCYKSWGEAKDKRQQETGGADDINRGRYQWIKDCAWKHQWPTGHASRQKTMIMI